MYREPKAAILQEEQEKKNREDNRGDNEGMLIFDTVTRYTDILSADRHFGGSGKSFQPDKS